jgi:acido-empty-quinoprotein group A
MRWLLVLIALCMSAPGKARADDEHAGRSRLNETWPTYHGDGTGQRHSLLHQVHAANVASLGLVWVYHASTLDDSNLMRSTIKATPLEQEGVLYFSLPNHVWAIDARTGRPIWHFVTQSGTAIGNRGVALYGRSVLFETPDDHLVSLDATTGQEQWRVEIADPKMGYTSTMAPIVIGKHLIVAAGGDSLDLPGYLQSRDPETGALQWSWRTTPRRGERGSRTWPNQDAMDHGGGMPWLPGTYDRELNLIYWGTGNPNPVHAGQGRSGDNLWTCSIVALNADTGKLVWYYQVSPHDTHDWDAVQTPVLFDGEFAGHSRKLLMQASRNGYFFLLDRATGEHLLTAPYVAANWAIGLDKQGRPIPNPDKEPRPDGTLVNPSTGGAANWPPPSFDPGTGLLFVNIGNFSGIYYLTDLSRKPAGFGGREEFLAPQPMITAIDYRTGQATWTHPLTPGINSSGLLSTEGQILFSGDSEQNFGAFDTRSGKSLWHVGLGALVSNAPITYELNGRQYIVVAAGMDLYAFSLPPLAAIERP